MIGFVATSDEAIAKQLRSTEVARPYPARSTHGSYCAGSRRSPSHAPALRERPRDRGVPRRACAVERPLPGPAVAPGSRGGAAPDARLRLVSFLAASGGEAVALVARTKLFLLAESLGGVEKPDRAPGPDDARLDGRRRSPRRAISCAGRSGSGCPASPRRKAGPVGRASPKSQGTVVVPRAPADFTATCTPRT